MTCIRCNHGTANRFGTYGKARIQRFRWNTCHATFITHKCPLGRHYISNGQAARILELLTEGMGVRSISDITGTHKGRILSLLLTAGERCRPVFDTRVRNIQPRFVQWLPSLARPPPANAQLADHRELLAPWEGGLYTLDSSTGAEPRAGRGFHKTSTGCPCNWCSLLLYFHGLRRAGVAQLVEHLICNQRVGGSNPSASSAKIFRVRGKFPIDCGRQACSTAGDVPASRTKRKSVV